MSSHQRLVKCYLREKTAPKSSQCRKVSHIVSTMSKEIRYWWTVFIALVTMTVLSVLVANPSRAINLKIIVTPTAFTLSEVASTQISATLTEPILCAPDPNLSCSVILDFATSIPVGVSLSNSSIEWSQAEWSQAKTFTVTMTNPSLFQNNEVFHLVAVANSRSEYYSRFSVDIAVTVAATQTTTTTLSTTTTTSVAPSTTTTILSTTSVTPSTTTSLAVRTTANQNLDEIPATGLNLGVAQYAIWALIFGVALTIRRKIRQQ